jgi:beta-galactosidase
MYFQWRKGRGGVETFHGAVVDHDGRNDTQVFQDVTQVGQALERLQPIYDQHHGQAEVCILMDWENRWAIDYVQAGQLGQMKYMDTIAAHYRCLWEQGVQVDFRDMRECTDLTGYKLVVAPMLFMFRNGIEEKLRRFVETGGTLLMTYFSGLVDEHDLAFLGGTPYGLIDVLGLQNTSLDALYPHDKQHMKLQDGRQFVIQELCALNDHVTAETLGVYSGDYYAGKPCLTRNAYGKGKAYYLAAKVEQSGLQAIYATLAEELQLKVALLDALPYGVIATQRGNTVFLQNFSGESRKIALSCKYKDLLTGTYCTGAVEMPVNSVMVLTK